MKKFVWILAAASALLFAACDKYDDSALRSEIDSLKDRVSAVEKTLNETVVPKLNDLVEQLKKGELVVDVKHNDDGYVLYLTGGTTVPIRDGKDGETPVIGITKEGDIYYWTINGVVVTDSAGNKIPVGSTSAPVFRAREDGTLEYSVDNGKTWQEVSGKANVELEETDEAYILIFGETRITLPKAQAFTLKIQAPGTLVIPFGETVTLAYTILGAGDNEITEVDILNNGQGFDAEIEAETGAKGSISITNRTNSADAVIKVFVYATNHTGKSDIKAIVYKADQGEEPIEVIFEAVLDAELVPAAGGEIHLSVNSDEAYSVSTDADWISVATTKAIYEDVLLVTVAENEVTEQRSGIITVASNESDKVKTLAVLQEAAEEVDPGDIVDPDYPNITLKTAWVVAYEGNYEYEYSSGETELCDLISITGMGTQNFYIEYFFKGAIERNFDKEPAFVQAWMDNINKNLDAGNTAEDLDMVTPTADPYGILFDLFDPEEYEVFVLACDENGVPTGEYGKGEFEVVDPETATEEYEDWIGAWTVSVSADDKTVDKTFYILRKWNNKSYNVYGWDDDFYFEVPADYSAEDDEVLFKFNFISSSGTTQYYLMGYTSNNQVAFGDENNDDLIAKIAKSGSNYEITGWEYKTKNSSGRTVTIDPCGIGILGYKTEEQMIYLYSDLNYIILPGEIERAPLSAASVSSVTDSRKNLFKSAGHRAVLDRTPITFMPEYYSTK